MLVIDQAAMITTMIDQEDARVWILRNQLARRNLSDLDHVALALKLKPMLEEQAREHQGTRTDLVQNSAQSPPGHKTRDDLAKTAGVSHRVLAEAEAILTQGSPEVIDATRKGELSIHAAAPLATLSPDNQAAALEEARQQPARTSEPSCWIRAAWPTLSVLTCRSVAACSCFKPEISDLKSAERRSPPWRRVRLSELGELVLQYFPEHHEIHGEKNTPEHHEIHREKKKRGRPRKTPALAAHSVY